MLFTVLKKLGFCTVLKKLCYVVYGLEDVMLIVHGLEDVMLFMVLKMLC